jgi:Ran GTPase-activating protein (RanGAP) involved in mRNA processing and transport
MDGLDTDITDHMGRFGLALGENTKLEVLNMREIKSKSHAKIDFWKNIRSNIHLRIIDVERNGISDKVVTVVAEYMQEEGIMLQELNLSRNRITGKGLAQIAYALSRNRSIKKLSLGQNELEDEGLDVLAASLVQNITLEELSLQFNNINNHGIIKLSPFLVNNTSLRILDLSKNIIGSPGLSQFCTFLKQNGGLIHLNLAKNKEISDEDDGLRALAECLKENAFLQSIDISGIKISKALMKQFFLPAMKDNIFMQKVIGRIPPNIIHDEL